MTISTYAQLKTAITNWMDVTASDLTTQIDDLVTVAEHRIFREARTRDMETALSATVASNVVALPSNYVAMKYCYVDGTPVQALERRPPEWIYATYTDRGQNGKPKYFAREATNFIFGPSPDSAYTVKGIYYVRLAALSAGANALFTANPDLYLFACLAESEIIIGRDARIPIWEAKYGKVLQQVNGEDATEGSSGSGLRMRVG
jgi:hypothetical protein